MGFSNVEAVAAQQGVAAHAGPPTSSFRAASFFFATLRVYFACVAMAVHRREGPATTWTSF